MLFESAMLGNRYQIDGQKSGRPSRLEGFPQRASKPPVPAVPPPKQMEPPGRKSGFPRWGYFLLVPLFVLLCLLILIIFIGRPYVVRGSSMEPTLHEGDRVFVVKYRFNRTPDRGDVVVLKDVAGEPEMLIKRVVGIAGDQINIDGDTLVVNGKDTYKSTSHHADSPYTMLVPDDSIYVMGDNESRSFDSRSFGPVKQERVVGKAVFVFWPLSKMKTL